jgi:homoserine O-succinyltransferase
MPEVLGEKLMPVCLDSNYSSDSRIVRTKLLRSRPPAEFQQRPSKCITIGIINNMPDGALDATEHQFLSLLDAASEDILVRLSFHTLPNVPRNEWGARHVAKFYSSAEKLRGKRLDGLIVTGREPLTPNLRDEPYWQNLVEIIEWAKNNTYSTVWSCLAAHAALLHLDGISRVKSKDKHCGVFACERLSGHLLTTDAPSCFSLPHSRWNGIPEDALTSHGYRVLTRAGDAGVDTFVKQHKSLFVFFQGHPEYESDSLLLEYRRDIGRYFLGETNTYPLMPRGYFDHETVMALTALQKEAISRPSEDVLAHALTVLRKSKIENTWHSTAACIYRNWLEYICAQKQVRLKRRPLSSHQLRNPLWPQPPLSF